MSDLAAFALVAGIGTVYADMGGASELSSIEKQLVHSFAMAARPPGPTGCARLGDLHRARRKAR